MRTQAEVNSSHWFGDLPSDWQMLPVSALFRFSKGLSITKSDLVANGSTVISYGQVHSKENKSVETCDALYRCVPVELASANPSARVFQEGFIFADTSEDLDGCGANVRNGSGREIYGGYHTIVLNPRRQFASKYLAYLFTTDAWRWQIRRDLVDVKLFSVNQITLSETYIVLPPVKTQTAIVSYLDKRCAVIDDDLVKRRKAIEKLKEYKKSFISHAVTKGLDQNTEMKDSGVEWIGKIPSDWTLAKVKSCLTFSKQRNPGGELQVLSLYREYGVIPKASRDDNHNKTSEDVSTYKYVLPGDLVVNKMKAWQGSLGLSMYEGIVSPAYFVYKIDNKVIDKHFLHYLVRSSLYAQRWNALSYGIREGQWDLHKEDFESDYLILPPLKTQSMIAKKLDEQCVSVDEAITRQEQIIEKLIEYRKSIIHYAVTGKIDCTEK